MFRTGLLACITLFILLPTTLFAMDIAADLKTIYQETLPLTSGKNADYIPDLAKVNSEYFGIAIVTTDGKFYSIGDADVPFAIESISKPFVYALALQDEGEDSVTRKVGLNATGHSFNSVLAIEESPGHLQNPLVNAGAIQVASLIHGNSSTDKWNRVFNFMQSLSDGKLTLGKHVYGSESATNLHNRAIAELLASYNLMYDNPTDAVDRYTKACSILVSAKQLALMGATLANRGIHPLTKKALLPPRIVQDTLSQMVTNGLYEHSGAWWWYVGLPSKSGVGGGLLAIVPGKMAIVVFSPRLDETGNSVRGQAAVKALAKRWNLHVLH